MKRLIPYLAFIFFLSGCVNDLKKIESLGKKNVGVEVAQDIKTYYYGANGHLKGILTSPVMYRYVRDTPYMVMDEGLKVDFYNDSLQIQSVLTAKKGEYWENTNNILVKDSVVVTSMGGKRILKTNELFWDPKNQQFYTHSLATLTTPEQTIIGKNGLVAPADLSWYKFFNTSGEMKVDSGYFSPSPAVDSTKDTTTQKPGT